MRDKLPHFSEDQRAFIIECLAHDLPLIKTVEEFKDMYPDFVGAERDAARADNQIYRRIQKIKDKAQDEIQTLRESEDINDKQEMPYLSPKWRVRYFRRLLREVEPDDIDRQIKLLRELRAESKLLDEDNKIIPELLIGQDPDMLVSEEAAKAFRPREKSESEE